MAQHRRDLKAFALCGGPSLFSRTSFPRGYNQLSNRRPPRRSQMSLSNESRSDSRKLNWAHVALAAAGITIGSWISPPRSKLGPVREASAVVAQHVRPTGGGPIPLEVLGIKQEDFLSDRELRRRKTTQHSEAEEEIMELEEYEVETQWFRDLQRCWAAFASVGGIYVLYKGGVLWERWIQEQERKDMEEEIELTGTFIDPRAVRKDDGEDPNPKRGKNKPSPGKGGPNGDSGPQSRPGDGSSGGIDALEKLLGSN